MEATTVGASHVLAKILVPAAVGLGGLVGFIAEAPNPPDSGSGNFALYWGIIVGSFAMSALSILWSVWQRLRRLGLFLIDKGFDMIEQRVGMKPGDMPDVTVKTPLDQLLEGTKTADELAPKPKSSGDGEGTDGDE